MGSQPEKNKNTHVLYLSPSALYSLLRDTAQMQLPLRSLSELPQAEQLLLSTDYSSQVFLLI